MNHHSYIPTYLCRYSNIWAQMTTCHHHKLAGNRRSLNASFIFEIISTFWYGFHGKLSSINVKWVITICFGQINHCVCIYTIYGCRLSAFSCTYIEFSAGLMVISTILLLMRTGRVLFVLPNNIWIQYLYIAPHTSIMTEIIDKQDRYRRYQKPTIAVLWY